MFGITTAYVPTVFRMEWPKSIRASSKLRTTQEAQSQIQTLKWLEYYSSGLSWRQLPLIFYTAMWHCSVITNLQ